MDNRWLPDAIAQGSASAAAAMQAWLLQYYHLQRYVTSTTVLAVLIPVIVCLYLAFLKHTRQGPSFTSCLAVKPAGSGQAGGAWTVVERGRGEVEGGVSWLGERELRSLEAMCDTLLPGFSASLEETVREVCYSYELL